MTLGKQRFALAHLDHLRILDHKLVRVEGDLGEDFVMQADLLQAEHLLVCFLSQRRPLKVIHKLLHLLLPSRLLHCFFLCAIFGLVLGESLDGRPLIKEWLLLLVMTVRSTCLSCRVAVGGRVARGLLLGMVTIGTAWGRLLQL